jgi:hypothetical protein
MAYWSLFRSFTRKSVFVIPYMCLVRSPVTSYREEQSNKMSDYIDSFRNCHYMADFTVKG